MARRSRRRAQQLMTAQTTQSLKPSGANLADPGRPDGTPPMLRTARNTSLRLNRSLKRRAQAEGAPWLGRGGQCAPAELLQKSRPRDQGLTIAQAAPRVGLAERTIWRWIEQGLRVARWGRMVPPNSQNEQLQR